MNFSQLLQIIWTISAVFLIFLILLHSPKGDGLGGIGGQAQLFTSTKSAEKTLNQIRSKTSSSDEASLILTKFLIS